jgi:response regulator RpfG family c-di-GMP phosphodiesterase
MSDGRNFFNALIVDPDLDRRMRLRQAAGAVPLFHNVVQFGAAREAIAHLEFRQECCDVAFIAHSLEASEISSFIHKAKELPHSRDAAFVLVLAEASSGEDSVASYVMHGVDGFLFEPYSVNSLVEITELAARVRKERSDSREKMAFTLMVGDLMEQLDVSAFLKSCGYALGKSWKAFCSGAESLKTLSSESLQNYFSIAVKLFGDAPLPKFNMMLKKYSGVSSRVRKRMEDKLAAEVDLKAAQAGRSQSQQRYIVKTEKK